MSELIELQKTELFAWVGRDELGSGQIGLKQANAPAGLIPMVAVRREKVEKFYPQFEAQAIRYGQKIYFVRCEIVEVVRETEHGKPVDS